MEAEISQIGRSLSSSYPIAGSIYGWIPFIIVLLLSLVFSALYIHHFWNKHEHDRLSAITATVGLWITLLTALLLPVDVFLISFMKTSDGKFKEWATNETREGIEDVITYTYYTFYSLIIVFAFFFLPLVYFAYEEKDEFVSMAQRLCAGLRYTSVFFLFAVILFIIGAFIPYQQLSFQNSTDNMSDWQKFEVAVGNIYTNKGQEALIFIVNVLTIIGTAILIIYTGLGFSAFPIENLRGWRSLKIDKAIIEERQDGLRARISSIRRKQVESGSLSATDLNSLNELEEQLQLGERMQTEVNAASTSCWTKLLPLQRVFEITIGVCAMAFGLVTWVSLLIVNIDKVLHSYGYKCGYLMESLVLFNPLSFVMVESQKVFPIDYILYFAIVVFFVACTISGLRYIGIWCLCIRMFKIRAHHTQPQGLIMLCAILMYTVLALNILLYETIPQYTIFGSQYYQVFNATMNTTQVIPCDHRSPEGECLMTRASVFIIEYAMKVSFFSMIYYWMSWAFLAMVVIGFFVVIVSRKKSFLDDAVDPDDFDESDNEDRPLVT